jgi:hypothetical protein
MNPKPITIMQHMVQGERKVFAAHEWPECVHLSVALLNSPLITIDDNGNIWIRVENGFAAYKLAPEQTTGGDFAITCVLSEGEFSPPPADLEGKP